MKGGRHPRRKSNGVRLWYYGCPLRTTIAGAPQGYFLIGGSTFTKHDAIRSVEEDRLLSPPASVADQGLYGLPLGSSVMADQE